MPLPFEERTVTRARAIFFGTPDFAVPCLRAVSEITEVVCVMTQPDRPAGRGMRLKPPAVKVCAQELGLEVQQPTKVRTAAFAESLRALSADVAVVAAYGRILPSAVLTAPRLGCVNVHASLLPRWRGAAPVHWAIVHGDETTGVCLMQMDEGMDTGAVLACDPTPIGPDETAGELSSRLSQMGGDLLTRELPRYLAGELESTPQNDAAATKAPLLKKEDGRIDWASPAVTVHNRVRGMSPWPGAHCFLDDERVKVHRTHVVSEQGESGDGGTVVRADSHGIEVACEPGLVAVDELQPAGRRRMSAEQFLAGHGDLAGRRFRLEP
jgi:methionyl-tRNA formyltransferase